MIGVDINWWKEFFDEIYLVTDARSVCNQELTRQEVDFLEEFLKLKKPERILDLCGGHGRHCLELAKRGYKDLTVLDYSKFLVELGKKITSEQNLGIIFYQGDARFTKLKDKDYDAVIVMGNSFGYSPVEEDNLRILYEINRLLKNGGRVLLDFTDADFLMENFHPLSVHQANEDIVVCRMRELDGNLVRAREMVLSKKKGLLKDGTYCEKLYTQDNISCILTKTGFTDITVRRNFSTHNKDGDYGLMNSRMIVTAFKTKSIKA